VFQHLLLLATLKCWLLAVVVVVATRCQLVVVLVDIAQQRNH
jgi:hypothetical protein